MKIEPANAQQKKIQKRKTELRGTMNFNFNNMSFGGYSRSTVYVAGGVVAGVTLVAVYRNLKNLLKAPQTTDQPLESFVNNTDYDESFACDLLSACPR
jgi:hypothetical protein